MRGLIALILSFVFIFSWGFSLYFLTLIPVFVIALTLLIE